MDREAILDRVWSHLNDLTVSADTHLYFYCALELRFCIEGLFFEILLSLRDWQPERRDFQIYRPKDFHRALSALDPSYLSYASESLGIQLTDKDVSDLGKLYGQIGAILHLPREPYFEENQAEWKLDLERMVLTAYEYLRGLAGYKVPGE